MLAIYLSSCHYLSSNSKFEAPYYLSAPNINLYNSSKVVKLKIRVYKIKWVHTKVSQIDKYMLILYLANPSKNKFKFYQFHICFFFSTKIYKKTRSISFCGNCKNTEIFRININRTGSILGSWPHFAPP